MAPNTRALLVTDTAAYAPLWVGLSRPTTSTSTFWSTATMDSDTDAATRSTATCRRADAAPPRIGSGRSAATQPAGRAGRSVPPDQARTAAQRACPAAATSPIRTPTAAPDGPNPAATKTSTAPMRTPISTTRLTANG